MFTWDQGRLRLLLMSKGCGLVPAEFPLKSLFGQHKSCLGLGQWLWKTLTCTDLQVLAFAAVDGETGVSQPRFLRMAGTAEELQVPLGLLTHLLFVGTKL